MSVTTIIEPGLTTFSANDIYFKLQSSYSGDSFPDNYGIGVIVKLRPTPGHGGGAYDNIVPLMLRPDENGFVDFNLSSILDKAIRNRFLEPPIPEAGSIQNPYLSPTNFDYAVNIYEREGTPPTNGSETNIFEGYVILGGIDRTTFYRTYLDDIVAGSAKTVFSWNVLNREVSKSQLHWLNCYNPGSTTSFHAEFKLYDETLALIGTEVSSSISVPEYSMACFPGLFSVNLGLLKPKMFTMQIFGDGPVSPVVRYIVDEEEYKDERLIVYLNSFIGLEGMRCTGDFSRSVDMDRQKSVAIDNVNGVATNKHELMQIGVDWSNEYVYRTGYITKKQREALDEMLVNNMAWEFRGDKFHSIDFLDNNAKVLDTGEMLDSLEFKASDATKKKNYTTGIPGVDPPAVCGPANWQHDDETCWEMAYGDQFWELP